MSLTLDTFTLTMVLIGALCVFVAGCLAGHAARDREMPGALAQPPMRTADRARIDRETRDALAAAEVVRVQRLRAGKKRLKPSAAPLRDERC